MAKVFVNNGYLPARNEETSIDEWIEHLTNLKEQFGGESQISLEEHFYPYVGTPYDEWRVYPHNVPDVVQGHVERCTTQYLNYRDESWYCSKCHVQIKEDDHAQ